MLTSVVTKIRSKNFVRVIQSLLNTEEGKVLIQTWSLCKLVTRINCIVRKYQKHFVTRKKNLQYSPCFGVHYSGLVLFHHIAFQANSSAISFKGSL
eukprot:snap_masked-scaffold_1-processed-gene-29.1-mRNA-1 protein AED:1.00 eAED:1.00 QI:0/0/0/0/1/1/4/0/95